MLSQRELRRSTVRVVLHLEDRTNLIKRGKTQIEPLTKPLQNEA